MTGYAAVDDDDSDDNYLVRLCIFFLPISLSLQGKYSSQLKGVSFTLVLVEISDIEDDDYEQSDSIRTYSTHKNQQPVLNLYPRKTRASQCMLAASLVLSALKSPEAGDDDDSVWKAQKKNNL